MSIKEVVLDRAAASAPAAGYLGATLAGITVQNTVAVLTGLLVFAQLVKVLLELKDRRAAKLKESPVCPSETD